MATRRETDEQKRDVENRLRAACRAGELAPESLLLPTRVLAQNYSVTPYVVHRALQTLIAEGVLYTVPRIGTFVGRAQASGGYYLVLTHYDPRYETAPNDAKNLPHSLFTGFEDRIAALGGIVILMDSRELENALDGGHLPVIDGVFDQSALDGGAIWDGAFVGVPRVRIVNRVPESAPFDGVAFDDYEGGKQATRHLMQAGHRRIAFVGLHPEDDGEDSLNWSVEREAGWRDLMNLSDVSGAPFSFHPAHAGKFVDIADEKRVAREGAAAFVRACFGARSEGVSAVVAANDIVALAIMQELQSAEIPMSAWPAILGFDELEATRGRILTSLRLPWDELGRAAADLLWERAAQRQNGEARGEPEIRRVAMKLIPRLTCQQHWSHDENHAALAAASL